MLQCRFNKQNKMIGAEMMFDVMGFMQQLQVRCGAVQCSGLYLLLSLVLCAAFISPYRERYPPLEDFYLNAYILFKIVQCASI